MVIGMEQNFINQSNNNIRFKRSATGYGSQIWPGHDTVTDQSSQSYYYHTVPNCTPASTKEIPSTMGIGIPLLP
jgi:hypothetical protein